MARSRVSSNGSKSRRRRSIQRRGGQYGFLFFVVLAVTIASAVGFMGVMASVLAGG